MEVSMTMSFRVLCVLGAVAAGTILALSVGDDARAQGTRYGPQQSPAAGDGPAPPIPVMAGGPAGPILINIGRYFVNPYALTYGFRKQGGGWTAVCRGRVALDLTEDEGQRLLTMQPPQVGRYYINPMAVSHAYHMQAGGWFLGFDDGSSLELYEEEGRDLTRLLNAGPIMERQQGGTGVPTLPRATQEYMRAPVAPRIAPAPVAPLPAGFESSSVDAQVPPAPPR
jgi:hypothetical protein